MTTAPTGQNAAPRKRFYTAVEVAESESVPGRWSIRLDGRSLRTPARRDLAIPSRTLAEEVAAEWRAQGEHIAPLTMPLTRLLNSAIDGVAGREAEVRTSLLAYAQSDLLCYLAEGPETLVDRQSRRWGAIHAWAHTTFGIELELAVGVMPVEQSPDMLALIDRALGPADAIALAALHVITTITGSALLTLAVRHRRIGIEEAFALANLDEDFQIEQWGADAEAEARRSRRLADVAAAGRLLLATREGEANHAAHGG